MTNLQQIPLQTIDHQPATLADYADKVMLVVNTASKCGLTPQYEGPLYAELIAQQPKAADSAAFREKLKGYNMTPNPEPEVLWNFEKFLIGRGGRAVARFSPDMDPTDPKLVDAIECELKRAQAPGR